jgi:hypothetical protein
MKAFVKFFDGAQNKEYEFYFDGGMPIALLFKHIRSELNLKYNLDYFSAGDKVTIEIKYE